MGSSGKKVKNNFIKTEDFEHLRKSKSYSLTFRIHSTWSFGRISGITEIEIFDDHKNKIPLSAKNLSCENCGISASRTIDRLVNHVKYTKDE